jgi:hypothetical protein
MSKEFDYTAFDKATGYMTAFAILKGGEAVGRVIIRPGRDGAARLTAYAQVWGAPMVEGYASGYGYDKRGKALSSALQKLQGQGLTQDPKALNALAAFRLIGGDHDQFESIRHAFEKAGYTLANVL